METGVKKVHVLTPVFSRIQPPAFTDIEKNLDKLIPEVFRIKPDTQNIRTNVMEYIEFITADINSDLASDTLIQLWDAGKNQKLEAFRMDISCDYWYTIQEHPKVQFRKKNVLNGALLRYFNRTAKGGISTKWKILFNTYSKLSNLEDLIYQQALMSTRQRKLELEKEIRNEYQLLLNDYDKISQSADFLLSWSNAWLGFFDDRWTIDPLGFPDKAVLPLLKDSVILLKQIAIEKDLINKLPLYNERYNHHQNKLNNFETRLELIRASALAYQEGIKKGKKFSEWTVFSQVSIENECNYNRFHDASDDLKLIDESQLNNNVDISTDEKVCITVINIPFDQSVKIEKESKGFIQELQFTRLLGPVLDMYNKSNTAQRLHADSALSTVLTLPDILSDIQMVKSVIAPFISQVPPQEKIKYSEDLNVEGYKTSNESIGPFESDSSMKNTYTLTLKPADTTAKSLQKTFKYKAYKKSRIQIVSGVHFFLGDAPFVERIGNTNTFKLTSSGSFRYSAGIKFYFEKQTFSDITKATFWPKLKGSTHFMVAVDLDKPLENFYLGLGVDILPGLGVNVGPHLYKYKKYELYNGETVAESTTYRFRRGIYIAATVDGSLLNKVFTSFLKLRVK